MSAPSTGLAGGQLLVGTGGLGTFSAPLDSLFLPRMTSSVVVPPAEVPGLEPTSVASLPLPALMAALRGMTPAGAVPVPTVCVHTSPVAAASAPNLAAGDLLVPGGDTQVQTLRMLLGQLLPAALAARTVATGGTQRPTAPVPSLLSELALGLLNPVLFRPGAASLPTPGISGTHLRALAAAERSSVTQQPALARGTSDSEVFPRSLLSAPASSEPDNSEQLSRLLSADGGEEWFNFIRTRHRKRSVPPTSRPETRRQMSVTLSKIIRRIGFEKYGESLKVILKDLQPLKAAMGAAQGNLNKVQSAYQKFETDLNHLLEQTRDAQQIMLFILSSLFQENIVTRRKLEECVASNQVISAELRFPRRSAELTTLRGQLERKMRQYDALVLSLLTKKSALEVERQRLRQICDIRSESGAEADPFSLTTLLGLMTGLGEPSSAQHDVNVLLMRLFPDLYPEAPPPPPPRAAAFTDPGPGGVGSGWLQVLVPFMNMQPKARSVSVPVPLKARSVGVPVPLKAPRVDVPLSFSRQFLLRRLGPPRTAPLTRKAAPPPPAQPADSGDEFVMRVLRLMLQLYNAQPGRVDESKIKEELVGFGRLLLC